MEITIEHVHQDLIKLQRQMEMLNRILLNESLEEHKKGKTKRYEDLKKELGD